MDGLIASLNSQRVVLHFAGTSLERGGVASALGDAAEAYGKAGSRSVFVLQGGGTGHTLTRNLHRVLREAVFEIVLKRVLLCVLGKAAERSGPGARGRLLSGNLPVPTARRVGVELKAMELEGLEPYASLTPPAGMSQLTDEQSRWLVRSLSNDQQVRSLGRSAVDSDSDLLMSATRAEAEERIGTRHRSHAVLEVATGLLVRKVVSAARAVIERFRAGTHHGLYPTAVEEILREFCLAHLGAAVWSGMKEDAATAFRSGAGIPAGTGRYFLDRFIEAVSVPERKEVTVVGHGSGALLMNAFLAGFDARRGLADSLLPADFRLRDVVALAPMCTFPELASTLRRRNTAFERFRLFALTDEAEKADHLVPVGYPRSLLYFVSGVLERDPNGMSAAVPLSGMAHWYGSGRSAGGAEAEEVRVVADAEPGAFVWSPDANCGARSHKQFATDPALLDTLQVMIAG
ncbi:hypothetical protein [Streptomyces sp. NPDC005485]|uniref:hypothetical protein n=1 Tax=Streptomyces sp. NPDC005485 TaxID=3155591 RepID=UPI0033BC9A38